MTEAYFMVGDKKINYAWLNTSSSTCLSSHQPSHHVARDTLSHQRVERGIILLADYHLWPPGTLVKYFPQKWLQWEHHVAEKPAIHILQQQGKRKI